MHGGYSHALWLSTFIHPPTPIVVAVSHGRRHARSATKAIRSEKGGNLVYVAHESDADCAANLGKLTVERSRIMGVGHCS